MTIGDKLKLLRQSKKLTQIELANLLNKSVSTIQKYEGNKIIPSLTVLQELSKNLNVDISYFTAAKKVYEIENPIENIHSDNFDFIIKNKTNIKDNPIYIEKLIGVIANYRTKISILSEEINKTTNKNLIHAFKNLMQDLEEEIQKKEKEINKLNNELEELKNDRTLEFYRFILECINLVETETMKENSYKEKQIVRCGSISTQYKRDKDTNSILLFPNIRPY